MKKRLFIAEDELNFSISLFNYIQLHNSNIEVIGIARNGEETIKNIIELSPDILLLDLQMPRKTGIEVIEYIKNSINIKKIDIIIISADVTLINNINLLETNLIKHIFVKPFIIGDLSKTLELLSINSDDYIKIEVKKILSIFNFNITSKSYEYLICCIEKSIINPYLLSNVDNLLYNDVAKEMNVDNKEQVKWGIQKLMKAMNRYTNIDIIKDFFPHYNNPSPKIFIQTISNIVRQNTNI